MGYEKKVNKDIFDFNKREIDYLIKHNSNLLSRISNSFKYVFPKLKSLGNYINISKLTEVDFNTANLNEGKSYEWLAVESGDIKFIFRKYGSHITVYMKDESDYLGMTAFTFNTNKNMLEDCKWDEYCDNGFLDLNKYIFEIIGKANNPHMLDCIDLPDRCSLDLIYRNDEILSIDKLIFCSEELSSINMQLFSESNMFDMVKELSLTNTSIGKKISRGSIKAFKTELKDGYYHGVGIVTEDRNGKDEFSDVYSLTYYNYEEFMQIYNEYKKAKS